MSRISDFLNKLFPVRKRYGGSAVVIDIPAQLYYKELAFYTAKSLISNAISRSEIKTFEKGVPVKGKDYYLLNISPNTNETSSLFWHKVINKIMDEGQALVVELNSKLYCADSYVLEKERPILGDCYSNVQIGNITINKKFNCNNSYYFKLDNAEVKALVDGMYEEYGKILSSAARALNMSNGQKYKLHITGLKAGDKDFNEEFEKHISAQLKTYLESENAVYPEFDGYLLEPDKKASTKSADDFLALKKDIFQTVASACHIPDSMMQGNITNMREIISAFLTFGVDPYADMITETLNKGVGVEKFQQGYYYQVDTGKINHRDIFEIAAASMNLISSGLFCIDEVREELGYKVLNNEWSRKHFITKNFEEIERFLKSAEGGE